jgi:hypothetical protein
LIRAVTSATGPATPPTPGQSACTPRPPVRLNTVPSADGRLQVSLATSTNAGQATNTIRSIQFGRSTGAEVEFPGRPASSDAFDLSLPPGATQATFTVHRTAGGSVQVPFSIVDDCGAWRTFVGGGGSSF